MSRTTNYVIMFCIILFGLFGYLYYNLDFNSKIEYTNITISAEFNNQKIITGYIIETKDGLIVGNTSQSYEKVVVRKDETIKVYNTNIDNQNFYKNLQDVNLTMNTKRITLKLKEPKIIEYEIERNDLIKINLKSEDARDIDTCISWSTNYIFVKIKNLEEIKTDGYDAWGKCYDGNFTLKNSNKTLEIQYNKFGTPNENDFIKIILINSGTEPKTEQEIKLL